MRSFLLGTFLFLLTISSGISASSWEIEDPALKSYFRHETEQIAHACLKDIKSLHDWNSRKNQYREQLAEMLGLHPWPDKTDLKPQITGRIEREDFVVENLHFQSKPGLYVTANLYLPKQVTRKAPTILYVCGHGPVITNGISYGNKVAYQHHGIWFARNGYVCLLIDTLQLGEIQGLHHGTHREGLWWWNSRGYTPAGIEAWNSIRALDYLETRPEVDPKRIGVTGRSGGGAYSWWLAALDDRIRVAAPVAGITDLHNHVVDGAVEGHCDCMFTVNTYRWDYAQVAALFAPRPLLIANSDKDGIFPLDGVMRIHDQVRRIYELYGAKTNLGVLITEGPHKDTQDLQLPVFRWFNRHLKGEDPVIELAAKKLLTPQELKVFASLPEDAINTNIHATFVPQAPQRRANSAGEATETAGRLIPLLKQKVFAAWPDPAPPLDLKEAFSATEEGWRFAGYDFTSQPGVRLRLYVVSKGTNLHTRLAVFNDQSAFAQWVQSMDKTWANVLAQEKNVMGSSVPSAGLSFGVGTNYVWVAPRGLGLTTWQTTPKKEVQIRRRFMLLGQTLDGMRVWDIRRAVQACSALTETKGAKLSMEAAGDAACNALYAALFEKGIQTLRLCNCPRSHMDGPDYLNVLRFTDIDEVASVVGRQCSVWFCSMVESQAAP